MTTPGDYALELVSEPQPGLRLLRGTEAISSALERGAIVFAADGARLGPDADTADPDADLAAVSAAHAAMTRRRGLPEPRLPTVAAHGHALSHLATLDLHKPPPDDGHHRMSIYCYACETVGVNCPGC